MWLNPPCSSFFLDPISGADALAVIPGIARATQVTVEGVRHGTPFSHTLSVEAFSSFAVHDGDTITVRADGYAETILVRLEGEYQGPTVLAVRRGARLIDVLNHVPVNPSLANVGAVHIRRASVVRAQKHSIDQALFRLERSALLALSSSSGESAIRAKEAELTLSFVERARLIQPLGRVVTARNGVQHNLRLEQDDVHRHSPTNECGEGERRGDDGAGGHAPGGDVRAGLHRRCRWLFGPSGLAQGDHHSAERRGHRGRPSPSRLPRRRSARPPACRHKTLQNFADVTQVVYQIAVSAAVMVAIM